VDTLPDTASSATVNQINDMWQYNPAILPSNSFDPQHPDPLDEYLSSLAYWKTGLLRSHKSEVLLSEEIIAYLTDQSMFASNGSFWKPFIGAFG